MLAARILRIYLLQSLFSEGALCCSLVEKLLRLLLLFIVLLQLQLLRDTMS